LILVGFTAGLALSSLAPSFLEDSSLVRAASSGSIQQRRLGSLFLNRAQRPRFLSLFGGWQQRTLATPIEDIFHVFQTRCFRHRHLLCPGVAVMRALVNRLLKRKEGVIKQDDFFRPSSDPARAIYDAFVQEATKRRSVPLAVWCEREIDVVHATATAMASTLNLRAPTRDEVVSAEIYARGSADYGAKWAYQVVNRMRPTT
jgi:hypothetical protein